MTIRNTRLQGGQRSNRLANHGNMQAYGCKKISYKDTSMGSLEDPHINSLMRMVSGIKDSNEGVKISWVRTKRRNMKVRFNSLSFCQL